MSCDMFRLMGKAFGELLAHVSFVNVAFIAHPLLEIPDELKPAWGEYTILGYGGEALEITDTGIKAGLDFSGVRHYTFVEGRHDDRGVIGDVPGEGLEDVVGPVREQLPVLARCAE